MNQQKNRNENRNSDNFRSIYFFGCNLNPKQKIKEIEKSDTITKTEKNTEVPTVNIDDQSNKNERLNQLIPIDAVDSKDKNIYKKYGIEFSGNCYVCDLAELSITEKALKLTNVCDGKLNQVFEIVKITNTKKGIEIKTTQSNFVFTEIDKAPIYELKIKGKEIKAQNLRISKYYTMKKLLNKFEQHDCGDFEG